MVWKDFFAVYENWDAGALGRNMPSAEELKGAPPDEVYEVIENISDNEGRAAFVKRALASGFQFTVEQVLEMVHLLPGKAADELFLMYASRMNREELEEVGGNVDAALVKKAISDWVTSDRPITLAELFEEVTSWGDDEAVIVARADRLVSFGTGAEVLDFVEFVFSDKEQGSAFVMKALDAGVRFDKEQTLDLIQIVNKDIANRLYLAYGRNMPLDDICEIEGLVDEDIIRTVRESGRVKTPKKKLAAEIAETKYAGMESLPPKDFVRDSVAGIPAEEFEEYCSEVLRVYSETEETPGVTIFTRESSPVSLDGLIDLVAMAEGEASKGMPVVISTSGFLSDAAIYAKENDIALLQIFDKELLHRPYYSHDAEYRLKRKSREFIKNAPKYFTYRWNTIVDDFPGKLIYPSVAMVKKIGDIKVEEEGEISWDEYYDNAHSLNDAQRIELSDELSSFGSGDEVCDVACMFSDKDLCESFVKKALEGGVFFNGTEMLKICERINTGIFEELVFANSNILPLSVYRKLYKNFYSVGGYILSAREFAKIEDKRIHKSGSVVVIEANNSLGEDFLDSVRDDYFDIVADGAEDGRQALKEHAGKFFIRPATIVDYHVMLLIAEREGPIMQPVKYVDDGKGRVSFGGLITALGWAFLLEDVFGGRKNRKKKRGWADF